MALQPPPEQTASNQSMCHRAVKAFINLVWMFLPLLTCSLLLPLFVYVFLPFVLQHIFIKAAISKLPFIKTKQPSTNTRKQRGQAADPQPRRRSHSGGRGRAAAGLPRQGPRLSLQLRCHPFYKPHGYTQLWSASAHQHNL